MPRPRLTEKEREKRRIQINREKNEYIRRTHKMMNFRLHAELDADIIAWLESKPSMAGYIKELIRKDMHKED